MESPHRIRTNHLPDLSILRGEDFTSSFGGHNVSWWNRTHRPLRTTKDSATELMTHNASGWIRTNDLHGGV